MREKKWRRGPHIMSLDELARQKMVFWWDKPISKHQFQSWQFSMAAQAIGKKGFVFYAMPDGISTRFSDEDLLRAERRLKTPNTLDGRKRVIDILCNFDRGTGDVDDIIDEYEEAQQT